jgi:tetratricopeptide (TPR) repeat protein
MPKRIFVFVLLLIITGVGRLYSQEPPSSFEANVEEGDRHWNLRAEGSQGSRADPQEIDQAVASYREALSADPNSLAVRWRLMRALFFKGEYTMDDAELKKKIFNEGRLLGDETVQVIRHEAGSRAGGDLADASAVELAPFFKGSPDVVGCFFWASASWGKWALAYGKFQAVRQGAAGKIRDLATAVTLMNDQYGEGGGYRVLGRLYHQTPYVPFLTGWASTRDAVKFLRRAYAIGPRNSVNRLYLAEALWDLDRDTRNEAVALAEELAQDAPRAEYLVEDRRSQELARSLLESWKVKKG